MTPDPEPLASARVEAYLDQLLVPLSHNLSPFHWEELRRELRAHLWGRVEAYRELDQSEEEAVTEALRQFGGAEDFLEQWKQKWAPPSGPLTLRIIYEAGKSALGPSLQGIVGVNLLYVVVQECIWHFPNSLAIKLLNHHSDALGLFMTGFAFLLVPLAVGTRYGRQTSERAGVGMMAALLAEIVVGGLLYGAAALMLDNGLSPGITVTDMLFNFVLALLAIWVPLAGGAAAVSSRRTQRGQDRRLA